MPKNQLLSQLYSQLQSQPNNQLQNQLNKPPLDLVELGHVLDAYGLQGWVKIRGGSADSPALLHAKTWWLCNTTAVNPKASPKSISKPILKPIELQSFRVLKAKLHAGFVVAALEGIGSRDEALALKSCTVQVPRSLFPPPLPDEFYWVDLQGCTVLNTEGVVLGVVDEIVDHGAHPILIANKHWIPFVPAFVSAVDLPSRQITVDWQPDYAD